MTISGAHYMILSALAFSVMALFVKLAAQAGIPPMEIVAARALVSLVISYYLIRRYHLSALGQRRGLLLARGLVGFLALSCVYYALTALPLAEATVLQYLHPMFTALLGVVLLRERLQGPTLACIALSFLGVLCIARPGFGALTGAAALDADAVLIGVLGAFGSACAYILVRKLSATDHPLVIVLYFPLVTLPATLPFLWGRFVMPEGMTWLYLLAVGVTTQIGQVTLTKGMQLETAGRATSFSYMQVVFAMLWGILFFAEIPSLWTLTGAVLIIGGAYLNLRFRRKV